MLQVGDEGVLNQLQENILQFVLVKKKVGDVIVRRLIARIGRARKIHSQPALHHLIVKLENFEEGSVPYILPEINLFDSHGGDHLVILYQSLINLIELQDQLVDQGIYFLGVL